MSFLKDASGIARVLQVPAYQLRVVKGPDSGKKKRVVVSRLILGTAPSAGFRLGDPTVSAVHCEIESDARGFLVRDLEAKNGVLLDGRQIREARLKPKDELVVGESTIRFNALDEAEESPLHSGDAFGKLLGRSPRMRQLYAELERVAGSDANVLLQGETGTGKELAADALVAKSHRRDKPLVVINCGALPLELAASELFGREAGAYTGSTTAQAGAFERAQGGTVFLDEVAELPLELQPALLGVLERKSVQRLGGNATLPLDFRLISATHRELAREVNRGTFRADLYYRLAGVEVRMPSLREHREDIPELIAHFVEQLPGTAPLSPAALERLYAAEYPGNVRELRAQVERALLGLAPNPSPVPTPSVTLEVPYRVQKEQLIQGFERTYLTALFEAAKGNVSEAARRSGINRVHLYEMIQRLNLPAK